MELFQREREAEGSEGEGEISDDEGARCSTARKEGMNE